MENGRLGKYEIRGTLGKGAMGTVYDGYDAIIDRRVAIKTMSLPDPSDGEAQDELARFRREAQAAGRLTHPNIVAVFDYGEDGNIAFIVMEYAPGTELKKLLDRGDRLPVAEAVRIMDGVLAGLQYSHERGVVHRDIKPGNVIISPDGTVKIADFGIARIESSSMTQAGTVMGTPAYMSPEQFMGQTVNARTDIYSAGAMFYQLLTGERPFEGGMTAIMHKALNTIPPRPSELSVTSPQALDAVVAKAMAKRPEDRFETAAAFASAIRDAMSGGGIGLADNFDQGDATMVSSRAASAPAPAPALTLAPPPRQPASSAASRPAKSRAPLFAGVALGVLVLLGLGGYFALSGGSASTPKLAAVTQPVVPVIAPQTALPDTPPPPVEQPVTQAAVSQPTVTQPPVAQPPAPSASPVTPLPVATSQIVTPQPAAPAPASPPPAAPQMAPQPVVAPPTVSPPAVVPQAVIPAVQTASIAATPGMIRDALGTILHPPSCSLVHASETARGAALSGVVGRAAEPALRQYAQAALPANSPADALAFRLDSFEGPYCPALDVVRPATMVPMALNLRNNVTRLRKDENIVPQITTPDFPSWVQLDYFSSDGGLTHLHPTDLGPAKLVPAHTIVAYGNTKQESWAVDAPFGTDMILAIASSQPLFAANRPADETTQAYLQALRSALDEASRRGVKVAANAMLVETALK